MRLPNVPISNGVSCVSPITISIFSIGTCNSSDNRLAQRGPNVLPDFNFPRVNRDLAVLANVKPRVNFVGKGFAAPLPIAARLLRDDRRLQNRDDHQSRSEKLEKFAPIEIKAVRGRRPEFVSFRLQRNSTSDFALIGSLLSPQRSLAAFAAF